MSTGNNTNGDCLSGLNLALEAIGKLIKPGDLAGNGTDKTAERNGLILAYNEIARLTDSAEVREGVANG
jgi:uncharacterized SAM-dependent methyltransferase